MITQYSTFLFSLEIYLNYSSEESEIFNMEALNYADMSRRGIHRLFWISVPKIKLKPPRNIGLAGTKSM